MVKVCGVRTIGDLSVLKKAGVTAVGINLVPHSPRFVDMKLATSLCAAARDLGLLSVAVMMDPAEEALASVLDQMRVDMIQLHGQENVDILQAVSATKIIKAVSWSGREREKRLAAQWRSACAMQDDQRSPGTTSFQAFLVDAYAPSEGGGTGKLARWDLLNPRPRELQGVPLILAGGLDPGNVSAAIEETQPQGVDVASGVEVSAGIKSPELVTAFASNARRAFARIADRQRPGT